MSLTLRPVIGKEKSRMICAAFAHGAPRNAVGDVFFGTESQMVAWQQAQRRAAAGGAPYYYCDNAYTDPQRQVYFRVTKNALQIDPTEWIEHADGTRERRLRHSDGRRLEALRLTIKPWRDKPSGEILVCPQSDSFMKSTLGRMGNWTQETVDRLKAWGFGDRIRVRPWNRDKKQAFIELHNDLDHAALVVTWSSSSAITALYEGIPAISEDGAANALTGPLTAEAVADPPRPSMDERRRFFEILADNQFTLDEMRNGTAWRWLERTSTTKETR